MSTIPLCQIAFSVLDGPGALRWYQRAFGLTTAGGTRMFRGPLATRVQGLPKVASTCRWLLDAQDFFQLEMFQFARPKPRPRRPDARPCDIGYARVGIHVAEFDAALVRLAQLDARPLAPPVGPIGARRACVRDLEGNFLERMEDDPRGPDKRARPRRGAGVAVRSITLSVPDLGRARRFFADTLGLRESPVGLHEPGHEALWGLDGAKCDALVLDAGDLFVELVQYTDPTGRAWPDGYRISDQGLLNVAFGFRDKAAFEAAYARCRAAGHRPNGEPLGLGAWSVVYVNDDQGFSVELLFVRPWYDGRMGFKPHRPLLGDGPRPGAVASAAVAP